LSPAMASTPWLPLLVPSLVSATLTVQPLAWSVPARCSSSRTPPATLSSIGSELEPLSVALNRANELVQDDFDGQAQVALWRSSGRDPTYKVSGARTNEPSFTRLFTHETWASYTGKLPLTRWLGITATWRFSTILRCVFPVSLVASLWAYLIAGLPGVLLPRTSPVPMSLMGTALGLLLVFRTNNSYLRLSEARELWSQVVILCRDLSQTVSCSLLHDEHVPHRQAARDSASRICRYLAAFAWELRAKLTGGPIAESTRLLEALLPAGEAAWIAAQRSRPIPILYALRREINDQFRQGNLPCQLHRKLEEDVRALDTVVGSCERLFSSPLPPTLSRHIVRCLQLWLFGLPFVLAGTMAPLCVGLWVFVVSYAFVGIDEVGVQVEQPFEIIPMTRICKIVMSDLEETFLRQPV